MLVYQISHFHSVDYKYIYFLSFQYIRLQLFIGMYFFQKWNQWDSVQLQPVPHEPLSGQHVHHHAAHPVVPATGNYERLWLFLSVTLSQHEGCLYTKCQKHGYVSHVTPSQTKPFVLKPPRHNPSQVPISSKTQLAPRGLRLTLKSCSLFLDFNLFSLLLRFSMTQRK